MTLEIFAIVISLISLISTIFFTIWNVRPHIKMEFLGASFQKDEGRLLIAVTYHNSSPVGGCIQKAFIVHNARVINCIEANERFDTSGITFRNQNGNIVDVPDKNLRTPISIGAFQCDVGVFIFPIKSLDVSTWFEFYYNLVGSKRPHRLSIPAIQIQKSPNVNDDTDDTNSHSD